MAEEPKNHYKVMEVRPDLTPSSRWYGAHVVVLAPVGGNGQPVKAGDVLEAE